MPYFRWLGIDRSGAPQRGLYVTRTHIDLEKELTRHHIQLSHFYKIPRLLVRPSYHEKNMILHHLSALLGAGIRVQDTLSIVASCAKSAYVKGVFKDCARMIESGYTLSQALTWYPELFDQLTLHCIKAGEQSGALPEALAGRFHHTRAREELRSKMRSALLIPCITALFLSVSICFFFIIILPRFYTLLRSLGKPLSGRITFLVAVSEHMRNPLTLTLVGVGLLFVALLFRFLKKYRKGIWYDRILLRIPFLGSTAIDEARFFFLKTGALLVKGGTHLVPALTVVAASIPNTLIQQEIANIAEHVASGIYMSEAITKTAPLLQCAELDAFLVIGERSGKLAHHMDQGSLFFYTRLMHRLDRLSKIVYPLTLAIVGAALGLLIAALYEPLFSLTSALS